MFNNSKYTKTYYSIIFRAQKRLLEGYKERHHIIPRSLGGNNKKENIVDLTAREHYICHLLLTKMTEGEFKKKMTYAAWTMARTRNIKTNSRVYSRLKEAATNQLRLVQTGITRGPMSEEHKAKIRAATIKRYENPEERKKTGESIKGRPSPTTGMRHSPETKEKIRLSLKKRRIESQQ